MATREQYEAEKKALDSLIESKQAYQELALKESANLKDYIKIQKQYEIAVKLNLDTQEALREELEVFKGVLSDNEQQFLKYSEQVEESARALEETRKEIEASEKAFEKFEKRLGQATSALDKFAGVNVSSLTTLSGFAGAVVDLAHKLNTLSVGLGRTTGYTTDFQDNLTRLTKQSGKFAITLEESAEIIGGLSTGMARFNMLGEDQQDVLQNIAARFKRLGVDIGNLAPAIDNINFAFGMTGQAAAAATRSLEDMADEVGRPLNSVIQDLNELAPTLSRFGQRGLEVFRQLNTQARGLGLTVKQAFDFTELFDTFESAANVAGRLNAQLGLQLNSVELLKASSEDRIDILRQEFELQGLNFDSMGRRQRQMISSILQTDEATAARLLGDQMDITKFQKQKAKEKTISDMVSMQERMTALMEQFLLPLGEYLQEIMRAVVNSYDTLKFYLPKVLMAIVALRVGGSLLRSKGLLGKVPGAGGTFVQAGSATALTGRAAALAGAKSTLTKVPIAGALIAGGMDAYSEYQQSGSLGRAGVQGASTAGGALAGAAAGAAIGSVVPIIGTAIGGLIGGIAGTFGGGALGRFLLGKPKDQQAQQMEERMNRSRQEARRASMNTSQPNVSVGPVSVELDGKVLGKFTLNTVNGAVSPVTATSITY